MSQVLINAAGFSNLSASAPAGWPANITWPGGISPNTAVTLTMNQADFVSMLTWLAAGPRNAYLLAAVGSSSVAPTSQQLLQAWLDVWVKGSITATQQFQTTPAAPPAPISITGT